MFSVQLCVCVCVCADADMWPGLPAATKLFMQTRVRCYPIETLLIIVLCVCADKLAPDHKPDSSTHRCAPPLSRCSIVMLLIVLCCRSGPVPARRVHQSLVHTQLRLPILKVILSLYFSFTYSPIHTHTFAHSNAHLEVRAVRPVAAGAELTIAYLEPYLVRRALCCSVLEQCLCAVCHDCGLCVQSRSSRRMQLKNLFYIADCQCGLHSSPVSASHHSLAERCSEPPETARDRFLSAFVCPACKTGVISVRSCFVDCCVFCMMTVVCIAEPRGVRPARSCQCSLRQQGAQPV